MIMKESSVEAFGDLIDDLDSLYHGLSIPLQAEVHIEQLKNLLPEKIQLLKDFFVELTGENPWE